MLAILHEDNHCLAVDKPAGMLSQGDATGDPSAVDSARAYLKAAYDKPGNVYVGPVHRLERPTSGLLLLARTSQERHLAFADPTSDWYLRTAYLHREGA